MTHGKRLWGGQPLMLVATIALGLAGCASPGARAPLDTPASPHIGMAQPTTWEGRMSLKLAPFGGEPAKGVQMAFSLEGTPAQGSLDLSTPLGTRMASVRWHEHMAVLRTADGEQPFVSLDALTRHVLGEALPIQALMAWLQGGPDAQQPWQGTPEGNRQHFMQAGWTVDLSQRDSGYIDAQRPPGADQRGAALRVRIDR